MNSKCQEGRDQNELRETTSRKSHRHRTDKQHTASVADVHSEGLGPALMIVLICERSLMYGCEHS